MLTQTQLQQLSVEKQVKQLGLSRTSLCTDAQIAASQKRQHATRKRQAHNTTCQLAEPLPL